MDDAAMIDYFSSSSGHFWVPQAVNDRNYWWLSCEPVLALGCVSFTLANQTHDVFYGTKLLLQSVVYRMSFQSLCLPCSYIRAQWQTASLTQNQCLQCVTPPSRMLSYRDRATPLNWAMTACMIKLGDLHYQTKPNLSIFPTEISSMTTPVSVRIFFWQLTCRVMFFLLKSFCWMSVFVDSARKNAMLICKITLPDSPHPVIIGKKSRISGTLSR